MRILYHHRTQGRGAEGNHIVSIVTGLRALGHEVDVLSPPGVDPFDPQLTLPIDEQRGGASGWSSLWKTLSQHMPKWLFEIAEIVFNVPAYFRVRAALKRHKYDLLFERYATYMIAGALAARAAGCQFALEVNDVSGVADRVRPQLFPRLCAWVERRLIARCDLGHAVSSYLGERLIEIGLPRERLVVAPNGFQLERMRLAHDRDTMRRRYGLQDSLVLGFAGWFVGWDRLDFLIEVFAQLQRRHPQLKLCLVGDGKPMQAVRDTIRGTALEAAVVHTGAVPRTEVYDHIQMFDIGILPHSNLFGSPIIMFEMMGLKVPLAAPRLPPIQDVQRDGQTALLFEPLDLESCVRQVLRLVESAELRATLAERAFQKLVAEHTWTRTAERILAGLQAPRAGLNASLEGQS